MKLYALPALDDIGEARGRRYRIVDLGNRIEVRHQEKRIPGADVVAVFGINLNRLVPRRMPRRREHPHAFDDFLLAVHNIELKPFKRAAEYPAQGVRKICSRAGSGSARTRIPCGAQ